MERHSNVWHDHLGASEGIYRYPWRSSLALFKGENLYTQLVRQHLTPETDVLEPGCGHGADALLFAPHCRSFTAYDQVAAFIQTAKANARQLDNAQFLVANSPARANQGKVRVPSEQIFDLIVSWRGPTHWLFDVRRVTKPCSVVIMLNPAETALPALSSSIPEGLELPISSKGGIKNRISECLESVGLAFTSNWLIETQETLPSATELYRMLTFGMPDAPPFEAASNRLEAIFENHRGPDGLSVPHVRFL